MAVTIRLARYGLKKRPFYRIVAGEKGRRRDGRFLEIVGNYDPMRDPSKVMLNEDKVRRWLDVGALPSEQVRSILKNHLPGVCEAREEAKRAKVRDSRRKRKERAAARGQASA